MYIFSFSKRNKNRFCIHLPPTQLCSPPHAASQFFRFSILILRAIPGSFIHGVSVCVCVHCCTEKQTQILVGIFLYLVCCVGVFLSLGSIQIPLFILCIAHGSRFTVHIPSKSNARDGKKKLSISISLTRRSECQIREGEANCIATLSHTHHSPTR